MGLFSASWLSPSPAKKNNPRSPLGYSWKGWTRDSSMEGRVWTSPGEKMGAQVSSGFSSLQICWEYTSSNITKHFRYLKCRNPGPILVVFIYREFLHFSKIAKNKVLHLHVRYLEHVGDEIRSCSILPTTYPKKHTDFFSHSMVRKAWISQVIYRVKLEFTPPPPPKKKSWLKKSSALCKSFSNTSITLKWCFLYGLILDFLF